MFGYVQEITGQLVFVSAANLVSLEGLRSLTKIGASLTVVYCPVVSVEGLRSLTNIGGAFNIAGNGILASVEGLRNLMFIRGNYNGNAISLNGNPVLARGLPFPALTCKTGGNGPSPNNAYVINNIPALNIKPSC
jgi:hypothetical protein